MNILKNNSKRIRYSKGQAVLDYTAMLVIIALALIAIALGGTFKAALMGKMQAEMGRTFGSEEYDGGAPRSFSTREAKHTIIVNPFASWF